MAQIGAPQIPGELLSGQSLQSMGLLDAPPEPGFDAITRAAMRIFATPVALVSIIDEARDRQYFKSLHGLPEPWAGRRETPLSHSFCQHVKLRGAPLVVQCAPAHPLVCDNLAIRDLNVIAYLGVPIHDPFGRTLGALCVIDGVEREWSDDDIDLLEDLAICVSDEIRLRASLNTTAKLIDRLEASYKRISQQNALRESLVMAFMAPDLPAEERFNALLRAACNALGTDHGAIARVLGAQAEIVFGVDLGLVEITAGSGIGSDNTIFSIAAAGEAMLCHADLAASDLAGRVCVFGHVPGSVIAAPIIFGGVLFGVLEFSSPTLRPEAWTEDEISMVSVVAMFTSAHLALHGQIASLRRSETALVGNLLDAKQQRAARAL